MGWTLRDGEESNRRAPRSFFIPPEEHRTGLTVGRLVKLVFEYDGRVVDGELYDSERRWLEVAQVKPDGTYVGRLASDPRVVTELSFGDRVEFSPRHVIAMVYDKSELGYDPSAWAYVDARVRTQGRPPEYVTLQPASPDGDPIWWGGIGEGPPDDTMTPGDLTDRWPQLGEVFRSDGGWWTWNSRSQASRHFLTSRKMTRSHCRPDRQAAARFAT